MKKSVLFSLMILFTVFFSACAGSPKSDPLSVPSPSSSATSPSASVSTTAPPSPSPLPQSSPASCVVQPPAGFDQDAFLSFLAASDFFTFLNEELASPAPLAAEKNYMTVRRILSAYLRNTDQANGVQIPANEEGNPYYPVSTLYTLTEQLFGLELDYLSLAQKLNSSFPAPEGMLCVPWEMDAGTITGDPYQSTLTFEGDQLLLRVDIVDDGPFQTEPPPLLRTLLYRFEYLPENSECPYRLVSIQPAA